MRIYRYIRNSDVYLKYLQPLRVKLIPWYSKPIAIVKILFSSQLAILVKRNTYKGDGFLTTHYVPWHKNGKFYNSYLASFSEVPIRHKTLRDTLWRAHIVSTCANWASAVPGDFVELGTWYGILAQVLVRNGDLPNDKQMYLVDAYGSVGFQMQGEHKKYNYVEDIYETVKRRFSAYSNVVLVRGIVPEILPDIPTKSVSFLMIDMNSGRPERLGLEYFWEKISPGGVIYFDDYGQDFPQLRVEIEDFLKDKVENLMIFPSGQAILIKK